MSQKYQLLYIHTILRQWGDFFMEHFEICNFQNVHLD